jgi:hypothetical protein
MSGATHSRPSPTASHRIGLPDGSIDWCCFHRFDARPVFARILDWSAGRVAGLRPWLACFGHGFAVTDPGRFPAAVDQLAPASS